MSWKIRLLLGIVGFTIVMSMKPIVDTYGNDYPCSMTGIGCESSWELLSDTWVEFTCMTIGLSGVGLIAIGLLYDLGKKNNIPESK